MKLVALGACLLAFATPLAAQRLVNQSLDSAALVRLHLFRGGNEAGRLLAPFGPDSMMFRYTRLHSQLANPRAERPATDVTRVEVGVGTHAWSGFKTGAIVCGTIGVLGAAVALTQAEPGLSWPEYIGGIVLLGAAAGGTCGLVGALIGSANPRWSPAP